MGIIDLFLSGLTPFECISCGYEGRLLCSRCATSQLHTIPDRCYRCNVVSPSGKTCPVCRRTSCIKQLRAATVYDGAAKELVWRLKFQGARAAVDELAGYMLPLIYAENYDYVVPVPTTTRRVRQRGYDQAQLLARSLARQTGLPYAHWLRRSTQSHQIGSDRQERRRQVRSAFRLCQGSLSSEIRAKARILLVDDVITTGATLEAAATVLHGAGIRYIGAITFAQA